MASIKNRILKLVEQTGVETREKKAIVLLPGNPEPTEEVDIIIRVSDPEAKQLMEEIIAGEGS